MDGKTDQAVALMKQIKVYPLAKASSPPKMEFLNGSGKAINTIHSDTITFFELLAQLVDEEPADVFTPLERFDDAGHRHREGQAVATRCEDEGAPLGSRAARRRDGARQHFRFNRSPTRSSIQIGKWQDVRTNAVHLQQGRRPQVDRRELRLLHGAGNSPAMMAKNVGLGSHYLWTYQDSAGNFLDGAKNYKLHVPPDVPAKNFWSVLVYDSLSRSELKNGQRCPRSATTQSPIVNADGSVDILFGPDRAKGEELDQDRAGQGLVPDLPLLRPN